MMKLILILYIILKLSNNEANDMPNSECEKSSLTSFSEELISNDTESKRAFLWFLQYAQGCQDKEKALEYLYKAYSEGASLLFDLQFTKNCSAINSPVFFKSQLLSICLEIEYKEKLKELQKNKTQVEIENSYLNNDLSVCQMASTQALQKLQRLQKLFKADLATVEINSTQMKGIY